MLADSPPIRSEAMSPSGLPDWSPAVQQFRRRVGLTAGGAAFAFMLGLGSRLNVQLIGFLPLSELAILLFAPFLAPQLTSRRTLEPCKTALGLALVWLLSQVITDLAIGTRWDLAARGAARVIVLLVMIPFFSWYFRDHVVPKIAWITVGSIPSGILSAYVLRSGVHEGRELVYGEAIINWETHWAFIGNAAIALVALAFYKRRRLLGYATVAAMGAIQMALGSRAAGAGAVAAVALTIGYNTVAGGRLRFPRISLRVVAIVGIAAILAVTAIYQAYSYAAWNGYLGERAFAKISNQSRYKYGLLLGGRPDTVPGILAIIASPIVGYGSWPLDEKGFYHQACELTQSRADPNFYKTGYPKIPAHSHVLAAWVEGGVFASFFWFYVIYVVSRAAVTPLYHESRLRLWATIGAVALTWHVMFSPISGRLRTAMYLAVYLLERRNAQVASLTGLEQAALAPRQGTLPLIHGVQAASPFNPM